MRCIQGSISYSPFFVPAMELMPHFDICVSFFVIYCQLNLYCVHSLIWFIWSIIKFHIQICSLLIHGLFTQVSSSSNFDSHQWHCRLCLWFLFRKNPFNQVITKENLGGIHWSICYNNDLCVCGKHGFFPLVALNTIMFYRVYYCLMTNFEEAFPGVSLTFQPDVAIYGQTIIL